MPRAALICAAHSGRIRWDSPLTYRIFSFEPTVPPPPHEVIHGIKPLSEPVRNA